MKQHRDFNPLWYAVITLGVCGVLSFGVYLASIGL